MDIAIERTDNIMSISLAKGSKICLSKEAKNKGISLKNIAVGLGWDCNVSGGWNYDLDSWALMISSQDKKELIYFGRTSDKNSTIHHCGDNLTGAGDGDDETINMKLESVPSTYDYILVGVTIYKGLSRHQTFKDVNNTFIRIYDRDTDTEICKYSDEFHGELGDYVSMLFGILYRTKENEWEFLALGKGYKFGAISQVKSVFSLMAIDDLINNTTNSKGDTKMAVSLNKGGKVSLAKVAADAGISSLTKVIVGLGWDVNRYSGGAQFDLDAAAFLQGANGKVREEADFVFYGSRKKTADGLSSDTAESVMHTGDNRTGDGDGDDEQLIIDLTKVPADVQKISITVTIDQANTRGQNFGMVENSYVHVADQVTGTDLIRYDLGEDFSVETAIVVCEFYRHNGEWKFNAVGAGFSGGLLALCGNFGIDATE